jgi:hypothetical protein
MIRECRLRPHPKLNLSPHRCDFFRPAATYALLRLPENLLAHPLSGSLLPLIFATANRNHIRVYDQARVIINLVEQPLFPDSKLASIIIAMITAFIGNNQISICCASKTLFQRLSDAEHLNCCPKPTLHSRCL